jgi:nucleoid DNA-binding protein
MAGKSDIVDRLALKVDGITKKQAGEIFDELFSYVTENLSRGDRVSIPRFGSFVVGERRARNGRNPVTGKQFTISSARVVRFRAGSDLKEALNKRSRKKTRE